MFPFLFISVPFDCFSCYCKVHLPVYGLDFCFRLICNYGQPNRIRHHPRNCICPWPDLAEGSSKYRLDQLILLREKTSTDYQTWSVTDCATAFNYGVRQSARLRGKARLGLSIFRDLQTVRLNQRDFAPFANQHLAQVI